MNNNKYLLENYNAKKHMLKEIQELYRSYIKNSKFSQLTVSSQTVRTPTKINY